MSLTDALSSGIRLLRLLEVALQLPPLRPPRRRVAIRKNQVLNIKRYVKECEILGIEPSLDPEIALEDQLDVVLRNISTNLVSTSPTSRSKNLNLLISRIGRHFSIWESKKLIDRDAQHGLCSMVRYTFYLSNGRLACRRRRCLATTGACGARAEPLRRMLIELSSTKCYSDSDRLEDVLTQALLSKIRRSTAPIKASFFEFCRRMLVCA